MSFKASFRIPNYEPPPEGTVGMIPLNKIPPGLLLFCKERSLVRVMMLGSGNDADFPEEGTYDMILMHPDVMELDGFPVPIGFGFIRPDGSEDTSKRVLMDEGVSQTKH